MKKYFKKLLFVSTITFLIISANAQKKSINGEKSNIRWYGEQITGKQHYGNLKFSNGEIELKNDIIVSGFFVVEMNSLTVEDLSGGGKERLEGHLKAQDFFNVSDFPIARLKITQSGKFDGNVQKIEADLTIKGTTHPVTFDMEIISNKIGNSTLVFDRSKYNVRHRSGSFFDDLGDRLILDDIRLDVELHLD